MAKQTHMGYPGVHPSPEDQDGPKQGEVVQVIAKDGANTLVRQADGTTRVVPNEWVKPA